MMDNETATVRPRYAGSPSSVGPTGRWHGWFRITPDRSSKSCRIPLAPHRQNVSVICGMPNSEDRVRFDPDRSENQLLVHVARHKYVVKERKASLLVCFEEQTKMEIES